MNQWTFITFPFSQQFRRLTTKQNDTTTNALQIHKTFPAFSSKIRVHTLLPPRTSNDKLDLTSNTTGVRDSAVRYSDSLQARRFGVQTLVAIADSLSSTCVQGGTGAHPVSYKRGTGSLSRWQSGRGVALIAIPSQAEVEERAGLHLYSPSVPSWQFVLKHLPISLQQILRCPALN